MSQMTRRTFFAGAAVAGAYALSPAVLRAAGKAAGSPFKVAVISDEISPDFDHACSVIAKDFGLHWVELRSAWGKNLQDMGDEQLAEMEKIMAKYNLRATDIGSPLFKTDWPGAPRSSFGPKNAATLTPEETFAKQNEMLEKSVAHAKRFKTDIIRCFDFYRLDDVKPYRAAMNDKLRGAAEAVGRQGLRLALENEFECNTATGREAAATLGEVQSTHLGLNWDPGNAVRAGELDAFPEAWKLLPKQRIFHCHVKNTIRNSDGKLGWSPVDKGFIDWTAQFRALKEIGYHGAVSLETHWSGAATHEESTRISWAGMKKDLLQAGTL